MATLLKTTFKIRKSAVFGLDRARRKAVALYFSITAFFRSKTKNETKEKTIVLSGFFGRGNCGDEAILTSLYKLLSESFNIIISIDFYGVYPGFEFWYPYNRCKIVHQLDLTVFDDPKVVALHIGGGGLPLGFGAAQAIEAVSKGKAVFLSGVDFKPAPVENLNFVTEKYYSLFSRIWIRTNTTGLETSFPPKEILAGADWAAGLFTPRELSYIAKDDVKLILREAPPGLIDRNYDYSIERLVNALKANFKKVTLLPFCPEDERMCSLLPSCRGLEVRSCWRNPEAMHREILTSSIVVTVGRLHPLIFSANMGRAAVYIEPPIASAGSAPAGGKAKNFCDELGWPYYISVDESIENLEYDSKTPLRYSEQYLKRGLHMVNSLAMDLESL